MWFLNLCPVEKFIPHLWSFPPTDRRKQPTLDGIRLAFSWSWDTSGFLWLSFKHFSMNRLSSYSFSPLCKLFFWQELLVFFFRGINCCEMSFRRPRFLWAVISRFPLSEKENLEPALLFLVWSSERLLLERVCFGKLSWEDIKHSNWVNWGPFCKYWGPSERFLLWLCSWPLPVFILCIGQQLWERRCLLREGWLAAFLLAGAVNRGGAPQCGKEQKGLHSLQHSSWTALSLATNANGECNKLCLLTHRYQITPKAKKG